MDYKMQKYYFFSDSLALLWLEERSKVRQSITRHPRSFCSGGMGSFSDSTKQHNQWINSAVRRNSQKQLQNYKLRLSLNIKTACCWDLRNGFTFPRLKQSRVSTETSDHDLQYSHFPVNIFEQWKLEYSMEGFKAQHCTRSRSEKIKKINSIECNFQIY